MLKILRRLWHPKERRKTIRASVSSTVRFRILDGKNPTIRSRIVQGKVLDISMEGLCIGTNIVQIDGLHLFHPSSLFKNKLEIEVELHPNLPLLKSLAEVKWYRKVEDEMGWVYKMGVNWESIDVNDQQTLKTFLKTNDRTFGQDK